MNMDSMNCLKPSISGALESQMSLLLWLLLCLFRM